MMEDGADADEGKVLELEQLRDVFDACEKDDQGMISLNELAHRSKSHVGRGQVDQILDILGPVEEGQDRVEFSQFYQKFVELMRNERYENKDMDDDEFQYRSNAAIRDIPLKDRGVFNENLKRAFEKDAPAPSRKSPSKQLKRRSSQTTQSGRIPLVNTSSEDEAEDSFDKKIASSLALARPMDIQQQFLVRGSFTRSTVRRTSTSTSPSNVSTSTKRYSTTSRLSPTSMMRMSPILAPNEESLFNSSMSSSASSPPSPPRSRPGSPRERLSLCDLERKVSAMTEMVERQQESDSLSSGLGSARTDLEEEISSSILLARKHGEERLETERLNHSELVKAMERERDLERRNFQLRFEQFEEERDRMKKEVEDMKRKLNLVYLEKDHLEEQVAHLEGVIARKALDNMDEKQKKDDIVEELLETVKRLTGRIQIQDQDLAETKEDNIVLRSQVHSFKEGKVKELKEGGRYKIFGGGKSESTVDELEYQDPGDIRLRLRMKEKQLDEQMQVNVELKQYVDKVLTNVMVKNPQLLENTGKL